MVGDRETVERTGPSFEEDMSKFQYVPEKKSKTFTVHFCKVTPSGFNNTSYIFRVCVINSICLQVISCYFGDFHDYFI